MRLLTLKTNLQWAKKILTVTITSSMDFWGAELTLYSLMMTQFRSKKRWRDRSCKSNLRGISREFPWSRQCQGDQPSQGLVFIGDYLTVWRESMRLHLTQQEIAQARMDQLAMQSTLKRYKSRILTIFRITQLSSLILNRFLSQAVNRWLLSWSLIEKIVHSNMTL